VRDRLSEFQALGGEVVVISFVEPSRLAEYLLRRPWPFPVLADPTRGAYRAFGLTSASWSQLLRPRVMLRYFGLLLRGRRPQLPREDVHQLGGDFILDRTGNVRFAYRSRDPADRPSVDELLRELKALIGPESTSPPSSTTSSPV